MADTLQYTTLRQLITLRNKSLKVPNESFISKLINCKLLISKLLVSKLLISKLLIIKLLISKLLISELLIAPYHSRCYPKVEVWSDLPGFSGPCLPVIISIKTRVFSRPKQWWHSIVETSRSVTAQ